LFIYTILISGKRSVFIVLLLSLAVFFLMPQTVDRKSRFASKLIAVSLIAVFSISVVINWDYYSNQYLTFSRFDRLVHQTDFSSIETDDTSYQKRVFLWNHYMDSFKESPFLGNGMLGAQISLGLGDKGEVLSTHSSYLAILTDLGLFGSSLSVLIFLRRLIYGLINFKYRERIIYLLLLLPVLLINYSENNFYSGQILFMYTMLVVLMPFYLENYHT